MPGVPPPLPPSNDVPRWLLAILWLLPTVCILLAIPVGIYWMYVTRGEKMILIVPVFGVSYIALLSVLAEINGRLNASAPRAGGRDRVATKRLHGIRYFVMQFFLAPLLAFLVLWVVQLLGSM